jgi:hypothetical protein
MNISIDQLMATIGRLHVQVDYLAAENAMLKNTIAANGMKETESVPAAPAPAPAAA